MRNIVTDPNDAAIAKMMVALSESMGISVIAKGVELQAQADLLARLGCHAILLTALIRKSWENNKAVLPTYLESCRADCETNL